jgi:hypothetical protein
MSLEDKVKRNMALKPISRQTSHMYYDKSGGVKGVGSHSILMTSTRDSSRALLSPGKG